jgi:asparagine synthase (glutamine-hydrolysing)
VCGIAGIYNLSAGQDISITTIKNMAAVLRHRGPDGFGFHLDDEIGLAHARLSIIDLEGGSQPIYNETKSLCIVFNGEIFNFIELRAFLIDKGHSFSTKSDTEVIIHLYEEYGMECLKHLNGQFAFALWDKERESLFLARDRVGIRPLFYTIAGGSFIFASEIKSLFMDSRVKREIDPFALDQIFTFWMTIPPRTAFRDILELPAGHYMVVKNGGISINRYWDADFTPDTGIRTVDEYAEALRDLLIDSTRLQLRADVPVGAYLSGGIDSSAITALINNYTDTPLRTFSVTFTDKTYDESEYQQQMIAYLGTDHTDFECTYSDIGRIFPKVIWHTEKPILRTAAAPLFLLSKHVRDSGYKVVLTGEGSDEILGGYDIFKEAKIRKFIARYPDSRLRPLILKRLYPYMLNSPVRSLKYAETFFKADTAGFPEEYFSHVPRWATTSKIKMFFSDTLTDVLGGYNNLDELSKLITDDIHEYDYLSQAQYIEIKTLLSGYLLSSQGDRVAMAHSVEGRFPFLDHRVIEFCCKLPANMRMSTLTEKYILKESMKNMLPVRIVKRTKQPYMAPDSRSFFTDDAPDYVEELLSPGVLKDAGYFDPKTVSMLVKKCRNNQFLGFRDNMAIVGILSTMLVHEMFIKHFDKSISGDGLNMDKELNVRC